METRPTRASRTRWLYFIPVLFFVLALVCYALANSQPYVPGGPDTPAGDFFWNSFLVLIGLAILGGIISLGLLIWRANASPQRLQARELSNRDLHGQRD
jgi:hypothetical protein